MSKPKINQVQILLSDCLGILGSIRKDIPAVNIATEAIYRVKEHLRKNAQDTESQQDEIDQDQLSPFGDQPKQTKG